MTEAARIEDLLDTHGLDLSGKIPDCICNDLAQSR